MSKLVLLLLPLVSLLVTPVEAQNSYSNDPATSQSVDAAVFVSNLLQGVGPIPVTTTHSWSTTIGGFGGPEPHYAPTTATSYWKTTANAYLKAGPIQIVKTGEPHYGKTVKTPIPKDVIVWDQILVNCASKDIANQTVNISKQTLHSQNITLTHQVSNTNGASITLGTEYAKATLSVSRTVTNSKATMEGSQQSDIRSGSGSTTVQPQSVKIAEFRVIPIQYMQPFDVDVIVDAKLSKNDKNYKKLSDVVPEEARRSLRISGVLKAREASEGTLTFLDAPFDPKYCKDRHDVLVSNWEEAKTEAPPE